MESFLPGGPVRQTYYNGEEMRVKDLGIVSFGEALRIQELAVEAVARGEEEILYLLEHPHVFTLGRGGKAEHLLSPRDWHGDPVALVRTNRGGDITYHGPGQLVGYPHLDLRRRNFDLHRYLRDLEETLIRTAHRFGVEAFRREGLTGVWTQAGKLASIGVGVRRWVSMHGFALNVNTDLRYFRLIHPCGIPGCPVTSLAEQLRRAVPMEEVKEVYWEEFFGTFATVPARGLKGGGKESTAVEQ